MSPTLSNRLVLVAVWVVALVGMVDAAVGGIWDQFAIGGITAALVAILLVRTSFRRPQVPVRSDLVRWMEQFASEGGEQVDDVADRAISAYRSEFTTDHSRPPRGGT